LHNLDQDATRTAAFAHGALPRSKAQRLVVIPTCIGRLQDGSVVDLVDETPQHKSERIGPRVDFAMAKTTG
jgi:hypothetical protein